MHVFPLPPSLLPLPVLVDPVDGQLEVCVLALNPDVVPREVVEAEAAWTRHFGLARAEVDVHLKWRDMDERFIGPHCTHSSFYSATFLIA